MFNSLHGIFSTVVTIVIAVFILQNLANVEVNFLLWSMTMPRALMLLIVFVLGGAVGFLWRAGLRKKAAA